MCLADCLDSAGLDTRAICLFAAGHVLCVACFEARGGGAGLCAICKVPTGVIHNRALESLRDLNASQRWRAGDASSVKTSAGAGAAGASDTGKASVVSLWRLHEGVGRKRSVRQAVSKGGTAGEGSEQEGGCQGIVCERSRKRSVCKECGGGSVCQCRRERSKCRECLERYCVCAIFWLLYGAGA